jgi:hypothetical protein
MNDKTATALVENGLKALVNEALKETIQGARAALRTDANRRVEKAEAAIEAANKEEDKKALDKARIELFEAECALAELSPLENKTLEQDAEQKAADYLTDADCIKKLVGTGFIVKNTNIKTKIVYAPTRAVTAPKIYKKLLEMINDGERAKRIMLNNISGVESIGQYLYRDRKKLRNKK